MVSLIAARNSSAAIAPSPVAPDSNPDGISALDGVGDGCVLGGHRAAVGPDVGVVGALGQALAALAVLGGVRVPRRRVELVDLLVLGIVGGHRVGVGVLPGRPGHRIPAEPDSLAGHVVGLEAGRRRVGPAAGQGGGRLRLPARVPADRRRVGRDTRPAGTRRAGRPGGDIRLVDELGHRAFRRARGGGALLLRLGGRVLPRVDPPGDQRAADDRQPPPHGQRPDLVGEDVFFPACVRGPGRPRSRSVVYLFAHDAPESQCRRSARFRRLTSAPWPAARTRRSQPRRTAAGTARSDATCCPNQPAPSLGGRSPPRSWPARTLTPGYGSAATRNRRHASTRTSSTAWPRTSPSGPSFPIEQDGKTDHDGAASKNSDHGPRAGQSTPGDTPRILRLFDAHQNATSLGGAISHCTSATFGTRMGLNPLWVRAVISPPVVRGYRCGVKVYPAWWSSGWQ